MVVVTLTATEGKALAGNFFAGETVMTLMSLTYEFILDRGCAATSYALLPCQPNPTYPTHKTRSPLPMRSLRPLAPSGLSNLPDNPTPTPDEKDGSSSGLSRASSGQPLEPDDIKSLTYDGYCSHCRVRRVLCKHGSSQQGVKEAHP